MTGKSYNNILYLYSSFDEVGNLYISNVSSKYEGLFACVAENIAGDARKNFIVNVIGMIFLLGSTFFRRLSLVC